ncbi:MAG TPA: pilus assembly protein TadG-related protein [Solirubrobacter sp.]|nr:pilus assembly protein TadG-related protein [Solirubrobacter sp.]
MLRRQDGQIIPALVMMMLALVAVGMLFFQVGRAAIFSTEAQTAADAAALAAAKNVQQQLMEQVAATGTSSLALINPVRVRTAAESYAQRNGGHVTKIERRGVDVKVWVATNERLGRGAERLDREDTRGTARARARVQLLVLGGTGVGAGVNLGGPATGGDPTISKKEWRELAEEIGDGPPSCGTSAATNDLVKLGELLRKHGFHVAENAELGDNPRPGVHSSTGYHYRCRNSAAIDVNHDQFNEAGVIDGIVDDVQKLGFRTIWRAAGHFDHIHIDLANSGPIGGGFGLGGAVGALEETMLSVQLIDWDADYLPFGGFGWLGGGGSFGGNPDPNVARVICAVLDRFNAPPKVRLAAFEAAIVESGVQNLPYGDRDSLGVFQQRPSVLAWGTAAQIMNPEHAATMFIRKAIQLNGSQSAGQLAQDVQVSAFPYRYDQVAQQAYGLLTKFC